MLIVAICTVQPSEETRMLQFIDHKMNFQKIEC